MRTVMSFWKSREQRIGVYTEDRRRVENAFVRLNELEDLLKKFLREPHRLDEFAIEKLISVHAKAACTRAVAASGKPTIVEALREVAIIKRKEMERISSASDSPVSAVRVLMCRAMLRYAEDEIAARER